MIEDKSLGLKVAEDKTEAKWEGIKTNALKGIEQAETEIEINKAIYKLAESKLKEMNKTKKEPSLPSGVG